MVKVENSGPTKLKLRFGVTLEKGLNDVEPGAWAQCQNDPITRHYLQHGRIRVTDVTVSSTPAPIAPRPAPPAPPPITPGPEDDSTPAGISSMSAKDAKMWIAECADGETLYGLLAAETRSTVRSALEVRLDELSAPEE